MLSYQFTKFDLLTNFDPACTSVSFHRQFRTTRLHLSHVAQGYSPTQTLHQSAETGKWEKWPNKWHSSIPVKQWSCGMKLKGVSMTTTHFSNSDETTGFKSQLNSITK